jgi:hypothetical protein
MGLMTSGSCFAKVVWKVQLNVEHVLLKEPRHAREGARLQAQGKAQNLVRPEKAPCLDALTIAEADSWIRSLPFAPDIGVSAHERRMLHRSSQPVTTALKV